MPQDDLFEFYRGDDYSLRLAITDVNDEPIGISGWSFKATMKLSTEEPDEAAPVKVDIEAVSGAEADGGVVYINLPSEQTRECIPTRYFFDVQRQFNGKTNTVFAGRVSVLADVTWRTA